MASIMNSFHLRRSAWWGRRQLLRFFQSRRWHPFGTKEHAAPGGGSDVPLQGSFKARSSWGHVMSFKWEFQQRASSAETILFMRHLACDTVVSNHFLIRQSCDFPKRRRSGGANDRNFQIQTSDFEANYNSEGYF